LALPGGDWALLMLLAAGRALVLALAGAAWTRRPAALLPDATRQSIAVRCPFQALGGREAPGQ
jgi:hypothetical protein